MTDLGQGQIFMVFGLAVCLTICLFARAYAGTFNNLSYGLNRLVQNQTSGIVHTIVLTTQNAANGGNGNNKIIVEFPAADDGKWCAKAGLDVVAIGCTNDGSTALPGVLTARCTQGTGDFSADTIYIEGVDNLSADTKYCVRFNDGVKARLGTPPGTTTGEITVKTNNGILNIDSAIAQVSIISNDQIFINATVPGFGCGNSIVDDGEICDGNSQACTAGGYRGAQVCNDNCSGWNTCVATEYCGDSIINGGEACDSGNRACASNGYAGTESCLVNCSGWGICVASQSCGDSIVNGNEVCDNNRQSCTINGYAGVQSCNGTCSGWGICVASQSCGDSIVNGNEVCDNNHQSCTINGYQGSQICNDNCSGWNTCVATEYCGDSIINGTEQCDGGSNCDSSCRPVSSGGGGGGGSTSSGTKVILKGRAYPSSSVTILTDGKVAAITKADNQANFRVEINNLAAGIWTFGVWAEDSQGRRSITFSFTAGISSTMINTIDGIFLPPTIDLNKTNLQKGETLDILGQTAPDSAVNIQVNSADPGFSKQIKSGNDGTWFYAFDTSVLEEGSHGTKAKATSLDGLMSTYSQSLAFNIGKISGICSMKADINGDKKVNLVDFSILLYNWGVPKKPAADINCDNRVNLTDFSIMMYYWTG